MHKLRSRSHDPVLRVYDAAGNVIETHGHGGRVQRVVISACPATRPDPLPYMPQLEQ